MGGNNDTGGNCVKVAELPGTVLMRDTQNRELGHLDFSTRAWTAFLADVQNERR